MLGGTIHAIRPTVNVTKYFRLDRRNSFSFNVDLGYLKPLTVTDATELLRKFDPPRPVRLLGVKVAGLEEQTIEEDRAQLILPL